MPAWNTEANAIFLKALDVQPGDRRRAYLDEACGPDADLRGHVESLLRASDGAGSFLEAPHVGLEPDPTRDQPPPGAEGPGTAIGPYKLLEQIGEGGMGVVYMAEQLRPVRRKVALKIIRPGMDSRQVIARFDAERQALAMMEHPNIAKVLDAGTTDAGRSYFVMELVKGVPITEYCDEARLAARQRLELFVQVCHAVQHAHQKGVIHRDLKPSNVLVTLHDDKPVPKVIDFGIAKAAGQPLSERTLFTHYAQMLGTPLYMSPEQAQLSGLDVDTRSDVYSLGVLLYELLTGTTPFDKQRLRDAAYDELRRIIREEDPPKPSTRLSTLGEKATAVSQHRHTDPRQLCRLVRGELDWIVMKALEKDRTRRYETANELAADVQRHLSHEPVHASPASTIYRLRKFARRNRTALSVAAVMVMLLIAGITGTTIGMLQAWSAENAALALLKDVQAAKTDAERAAARAEALSGFLGDAFGAANPRITDGGRHVTVAEVLDRAAERLSEQLAGQPEAEVDARITLGNTYEALGLTAPAADNFRRAHELARATYGPEARQTLHAANRVTWRLADDGDHRTAEPLARETLVTARRALGTHDPVTWGASKNVAACLEPETGPSPERRAEALALNRQRLEWIRQSPDPPVRDLIVALADLAIVLSGQRQDAGFAEAEGLLREAVVLLGNHRQHAPRIQTSFATTLMYRGKLDEAKREFRVALAEQRQRLGENHRHTLETLAAYSKLLTLRGDHEEAAAVCRQLLDHERAGTRVRTWVPRNVLMARLLTRLARAELGLGQPDAARRSAGEAMALAGSPDGAESEFQDAWRVHALALCALGRMPEAERASAERIEQRPEQHGTWFFRGCLLAYLREDEEYERLCTAMLERFGPALAGHDAGRIAKTYLLMPRTPEQCRAVVPLVERSRQRQDATDVRYDVLLGGLAEYRAGRFDAAIAWLDKARDHPPPLVVVGATGELLLAMSHHRLGDPDAARAAFHRAQQIIATRVPPLGTDTSTGGAENWFMCQVILREAEQLLGIPPRTAATDRKG